MKGYEAVAGLSPLEKKRLPEFRLAAGLAALEMIHSSSVNPLGEIAREWVSAILDWIRKDLSSR